MQLSNQETLPLGQQAAWDALNDVALLQASLPGCESMTPVAENAYEVLITAAVGPVKAKFRGKLQLEDLQPPNSYALRFEGQGGIAGHGKGSATVRLEPDGPDETILHYTAQATVGGKIAQIGSRLIDIAAQRMAADFFAAFKRKVQERQAG
ncbi:MAG: carbon monoxide dehydrogenase subunit G [Burkholderiales bacterium]|nr:carbon monoxide dehydrogenase subunit G [Burkholderiales bacterium]